MSNVEYTDFFLLGSKSVIQYECFKVKHPNFSKEFKIVRNAIDGIRVKEHISLREKVWVDYEFCPCEIKKSSSVDDLEQSITISMAGILIDEIMPELQNLQHGENFKTKPTLIYKTYRSDNLEDVLFGEIELKVVDFSFNSKGITFKAAFESLNAEKLGLFYTFDKFECLKSFI